LGFTSEIKKFRARNPVYQGLNLCIKNALKLTYKHLEVKIILRERSVALWTPKGRGEEGRK
jgi:hypothetical protein